MSNGDRARRLLDFARLTAGQARELAGEGQHNGAVRRAQEAFELALKAALLLLGVDFPKVHDPAGAVLLACRQRGVSVQSQVISSLASASAWLAALRAPAFYFEVECTREEAAWAAAAAELALRWVAALEQELPEA